MTINLSSGPLMHACAGFHSSHAYTQKENIVRHPGIFPTLLFLCSSSIVKVTLMEQATLP
uniref:Uncharacterized protein n=1 Tax=Arundo donax TaxID=35708 RepID=A0A0A9BWL0_ARUDO